MNCFNCGTDLRPVFPDVPHRRKDDHINYDNALHIKLSGGYGEFVDGSVEIIVCDTCAFHLVKLVPMLDVAIKQYLGIPV
jgi:hypothetical protein